MDTMTIASEEISPQNTAVMAQRPPSSMSLLAERLHQSSLEDQQTSNDLEPSDVAKRSWRTGSAPFSSVNLVGCGGAFVESSQLQDWEQMLSDNSPTIQDICDRSSPTSVPVKRQCRSHSVGDYIPRPIALRPHSQDCTQTEVVGKILPSRHSHHHYHQHRLLRGTQTSPYSKSRSAFTPTQPLLSPHPSSDYSISPEVDSPGQGFRPASVSSSGFHEPANGRFSSVMQTASMPDCSHSPLGRVLTGPAYAVTSRGCSSTSPCGGRSRCRSQPSLDCPVCCLLLSGTRTSGVKRRHPGLQATNVSPQMVDTNSPNQGPISSSAPSAGPGFDHAYPPGHEVFFFGSNRTYLVSLPRIASSPPSANSSLRRHSDLLSYSSITDQSSGPASSTTVTPSGSKEGIDSHNGMSAEAEGSLSRSWIFSSSEECEKNSSAWRDPNDPPNIMEEAHPRVLAAAATAGFCFRPLHTSELSPLPPFQELDLELIEND